MRYSNATYQIMRCLKAGKAFGLDRTWDFYENCPLDHPYFNAVLWYDDVMNLIRWSHFGSSANKCTIHDLDWIIKTIFETSAGAFLCEYTLEENSHADDPVVHRWYRISADGNETFTEQWLTLDEARQLIAMGMQLYPCGKGHY